jgi:hypothetical protein
VHRRAAAPRATQQRGASAFWCRLRGCSMPTWCPPGRRWHNGRGARCRNLPSLPNAST